MRICFPTENAQGLNSPVFGHFGSAPAFILVDSETLECETINNSDLHHQHGMCEPVKALGGRPVGGIVVGGIGMGALMKLNKQGIHVYRAFEGTVQENLQFIKDGRLPEMTAEHTCKGHQHGGGCGHH